MKKFLKIWFGCKKNLLWWLEAQPNKIVFLTRRNYSWTWFIKTCFLLSEALNEYWFSQELKINVPPKGPFNYKYKTTTLKKLFQFPNISVVLQCGWTTSQGCAVGRFNCREASSNILWRVQTFSSWCTDPVNLSLVSFIISLHFFSVTNRCSLKVHSSDFSQVFARVILNCNSLSCQVKYCYFHFFFLYFLVIAEK